MQGQCFCFLADDFGCGPFVEVRSGCCRVIRLSGPDQRRRPCLAVVQPIALLAVAASVPSRCSAPSNLWQTSPSDRRDELARAVGGGRHLLELSDDARHSAYASADCDGRGWR